jgi:ribonuclease HIII
VGGQDNSLKAELQEMIKDKAEPEGRFHSWERWIGSDECGKGDYFGALVVAAFALDSDMLPDLKEWGVMDSKRLTKTQITNIAQKLYSNYASRISCIVLKPIKYNEIIAICRCKEKT